MLIHLNGRAGVGKFTVAKVLASALGAKLLDNHTVTNVAFALNAFGSDEFKETVRALREAAFTSAVRLGPDVPMVLTNALTETDFGLEYWAAIERLARERDSRLYAVTLHCSLEENIRRLTTPSRAERSKLTDPAPLEAQVQTEKLLDRDAYRRLVLDVTALSAGDAAQSIMSWILQDTP